MKIGISSLVLHNITARPFRHTVLVLCVAAVVSLLVSAAVIEKSSTHGVKIGIKRLGADLVAVPRGLQSEIMTSFLTGKAEIFYMDNDIRKKINEFSFVESTSVQVYLKSLTGASCCSAWDVFLIGFDPDSDFTISPWLSSRLKRKLKEDEILVGAAIDVPAGSRFKFYGKDFIVAGRLDPGSMGLDTSIFIPIKSIYSMAAESSKKAEKTLDIKPDWISAVLIKLKPAEKGGIPPWKAAFEIEKKLNEISVLKPADIIEKVRKNLGGVISSLRSISFGIWPVAAILMALLFGMAANERKTEIGIMRAMGATRFFVFKMFVLESLFITLAGTAAGIIISSIVLASFSRLIALSLEVNFSMPPTVEIFLLFLTASFLAIITGIAASIVPAYRAATMEPYEAIRSVE